MFIKTIKYDFLFSKAFFIRIGMGMIGLALVLSLIGFTFDGLDVGLWIGVPVIITFGFVPIICLFHIIGFYNQSFFGDAGYLMLTLPVHRCKLLVSKVIVTLVWFNFILITGGIALFILVFAQSQGANFGGLSIGIAITDVVSFVEVNIVALFFITISFFAVTLSYSSILGWRVYTWLALVVGLGIGVLTLWAYIALGRRYMERVFVEYQQGYTFHSITEIHHEIGLRFGRIPIGSEGAYIDIFSWGMVLGIAVLALLATYGLLKKSIDIG